MSALEAHGNLVGISKRRPRRAPSHLRAVPTVTPEQLAEVTEKAAEETGQEGALAVAFLAGALLASLPQDQQDALAESTPEPPDPEGVRAMIEVGSMLEKAVQNFLANLRSLQPAEVAASDVRKSWSDFLERVHERDETIYITLRGERVAALAPPYVAEQYEADQAWFWTPEWQTKEAEADEDIAAGRMATFKSSEEFLAALEAK